MQKMTVTFVLLVVLVGPCMNSVQAMIDPDDPCEVLPADREPCGNNSTMIMCLWEHCCYDNGSCYQAKDICNEVIDLNGCATTEFKNRTSCTLPSGNICGIGSMIETFECTAFGITTLRTVERLCCDNPCPNGDPCDVPITDREACLNADSNPITNVVECFQAHCCFDVSSSTTCYAPNMPPPITCARVYPRCENPENNPSLSP